MKKQETGTLSIEENNVFSILKQWLYQDQDIVFRELISNATDAIEKRRQIALAENLTLPQGRIDVTLDNEKKTLTISDNGLGMSREEVHKYINQIAFSGVEDFVKRSREGNGAGVIGHFGVGFYSAFMLADEVTIETKSYLDDAAAVHWACRQDRNFTMAAGEKATVGTDIILHLAADDVFLKNPSLAYASIKKYFIFSKYEIYFTAEGYDRVLVNEPDALFRKRPEDIDDEELNSFYKDFFGDSEDPLFYLQFASLDLGVRGMLFFRNTRGGAADLDGDIHIYSRGIFIDKNMPELIPKYLSLQNGIIECDDLPLVVSRSAVQGSDKNILALIQECLTQEVAIACNDLFVNRREEYEALWPELGAFVKYGVLNDKTFASVMRKKIIYEDLAGNYQTIAEFAAGEENIPENTVFYSSDRLDQAHYIAIFKKCGYNALLFDHVIDQPLLFKYMTLSPTTSFVRIDSNIDLIYGGELGSDDEARVDRLTERIAETIGERMGEMELRFTRLADASISSLIVNDEESRRVSDMMEIYGYLNRSEATADDPAKRTLLLNLSNPALAYLETGEDAEKRSLIAQQLFDLALFNQQALRPEDTENFILRSEQLLASFVAAN